MAPPPETTGGGPPGRYTFRPLTAADLPVLGRWLKTPEVGRWWSEEDIDEFAQGLDDPAVARSIVALKERDFAYLQDYDPHAWNDHHFASLPPGSRGLDQFIGEPGLIGRGHGSAFTRAYVDRLFAAGVPAVGVDPHPDYAWAVRAYEKAGFTGETERETPWGRAWLTIRQR